MPGGFARLIVQIVLLEEDVWSAALFYKGGRKSVRGFVEGDLRVGRAVQKVERDVQPSGQEVGEEEIDA